MTHCDILHDCYVSLVKIATVNPIKKKWQSRRAGAPLTLSSPDIVAFNRKCAVPQYTQIQG